MHYIYAELAGQALKLNIKLQKLCRSGFSLFGVCMITKLRSELNTNTWRKQRWGTFLYLKFECHNRPNYLVLCISENGDIA